MRIHVLEVADAAYGTFEGIHSGDEELKSHLLMRIDDDRRMKALTSSKKLRTDVEMTGDERLKEDMLHIEVKVSDIKFQKTVSPLNGVI